MKLQRWLLSSAGILGLSLAGITVSAAPVCWQENGHCYDRIAVAGGIFWNEARSAAAALSYRGATGHLATITSQAENDFIVNRLGGPGAVNNHHLGGEQAPGSREPDGGWGWITGEPWNYSNWNPGEPNDGPNVGEDVLQFSSLTGKWNDSRRPPIPTTPEPGYIVEYPVSPLRLQNPDNGHWYQRLDYPSNWQDAVAACEKIGAHLVTITSAPENEFIYYNFADKATTNLPSNEVFSIWLGGTDEGSEGNWRWITGEPWHFEAFYYGEPNNQWPGGEQYLEMAYRRGHPSRSWNDLRSEDYLDYNMVGVCEWSAGGSFVRAPGDINGDSVADIAMIDPSGDVRIKDLKGRLVSQFSFTSVNQITDIELLPDINGNGSSEIAALGTGSTLSEVRDMLTGQRLSRTWYSATLNPIDLAVMKDHNGNGIPELAHLGRGSVKVAVRDAISSDHIKTVIFDDYMAPQGLQVYPDLNRNGADDLSVLQEHKNPNKSDKIEVRDSRSTAKLKDIWLGSGWQALALEVIADNNRNGFEEHAVLRKKNSGPQVTVMIRDGKTGRTLKTIWFDQNYPPTHLLTVDDVNRNGSDELVVFGERHNGANQKAQIKDSKSGQTLRQVFFSKFFPGEDITVSPDLNGNGSDELVLLGRHKNNGSLKAFVKDSKTGAQLGAVNF